MFRVYHVKLSEYDFKICGDDITNSTKESSIICQISLGIIEFTGWILTNLAKRLFNPVKSIRIMSPIGDILF